AGGPAAPGTEFHRRPDPPQFHPGGAGTVAGAHPRTRRRPAPRAIIIIDHNDPAASRRDADAQTPSRRNPAPRPIGRGTRSLSGGGPSRPSLFASGRRVGRLAGANGAAP